MGRDARLSSELVRRGRRGSLVVGSLLAFAMLAPMFLPLASAHNEVTVHVSLGTPSLEENPSIAFGPNGQVYAAYGRFAGGAYDIVVRADQDGWLADGVPVFTTTVFPNESPGDGMWGTAQNVPLVVDHTGSVYVAWVDRRNFGVSGNDIRVGRSDTQGSTFALSVRVSDTNAMNFEDYPSLAVGPSGTIYCVFQDDRDGIPDIWFTKSTDKGATWSANVKINDVTGSSTQTYPRIAVDAQDRVFVAWTDGILPTARVLVDRSLDGGSTWGADLAFGQTSTGAGLADIAAGSNGMVYLAWLDGRMGDGGVYLSRSIDSGASWSGPMRVNSFPNGGLPVPKIEVAPAGLVYVMWNTGAVPSAVAYTRVLNDGTQWNGNAILGTSSAWTFSAGLDASVNLFEIWSHDDGGGNLEIYARWFDPAPQPPAGVTAAKGGTAGTVTISWAANTEPDLGGYNVYRQGPGSGYALVATTTTAGWADSGRADGVWSYWVSAFDRFGHESGTNGATVTLGQTTDDRINDLRNQLNNLQTNVTNLQNQNNDLETDLHNANASLGDLKTQLSSSQNLNLVLLILVVVLSLVILVLALRGRKSGAAPAAQPAVYQTPPPPQ